MLKLCWELLHVTVKAKPVLPVILSRRGFSYGEEDGPDSTFLIRVWKVAKDNFSFLTLWKKDLDFILIAVKNNLTLHLPLLDISSIQHISELQHRPPQCGCGEHKENWSTPTLSPFSFLAVFRYYPHMNLFMRSVERYLKLCREEANMKKFNYVSKVTNS